MRKKYFTLFRYLPQKQFYVLLKPESLTWCCGGIFYTFFCDDGNIIEIESIDVYIIYLSRYILRTQKVGPMDFSNNILGHICKTF